MIVDRGPCAASADGTLGGPRCQEPATHATLIGRVCARHAEELRVAMRDPSAVINMAQARARTEDEIAKLVIELAGLKDRP